jgi:galactose mutarotase-like enzyme
MERTYEIYTLQNESLSASFCAKGAELISLKRDGIEYIWQGDPKYWDEHAPIMFPICGRLWEGKYTYDGRTYEMGLHGFARQSVFDVCRIDRDAICFSLTPNEEIRAQYPFEFALLVEYRLEGSRLHARYTVENRGTRVMYAAIGAHPGFCVPINGEGDFSDWYLEFDRVASPDVMQLSGSFATGRKYGTDLLENGKRLPLTRALFDMEGVFFNRADNAVTLASPVSSHAIRMQYDAPYFGLWQPAKTEPPFLCMEPWSGFAGYEGEVAQIETKPDMYHVEPDTAQSFSYSIELR